MFPCLISASLISHLFPVLSSFVGLGIHFASSLVHIYQAHLLLSGEVYIPDTPSAFTYVFVTMVVGLFPCHSVASVDLIPTIVTELSDKDGCAKIVAGLPDEAITNDVAISHKSHPSAVAIKVSVVY